jgi:hypothetical protein
VPPLEFFDVHDDATLELGLRSNDEIDLTYEFKMPTSLAPAQALIFAADAPKSGAAGVLTFAEAELRRDSTDSEALSPLSNAAIAHALEGIGGSIRDTAPVGSTTAQLQAFNVPLPPPDADEHLVIRFNLRSVASTSRLLANLSTSTCVPLPLEPFKFARRRPTVRIQTEQGLEHVASFLWMEVSAKAANLDGIAQAIKTSIRKGRQVDVHQQHMLLRNELNFYLLSVKASADALVATLDEVIAQAKTDTSRFHYRALQNTVRQLSHTAGESISPPDRHKSMRTSILRSIRHTQKEMRNVGRLIFPLRDATPFGNSVLDHSSVVVAEVRPSPATREKGRRSVGTHLLIPILAALAAIVGIALTSVPINDFRDPLASFLLLFPTLNLVSFSLLHDSKDRVKRINTYLLTALVIQSAIPVLLASAVVFAESNEQLKWYCWLALLLTIAIPCMAWLGLTRPLSTALGKIARVRIVHRLGRQFFQEKKEAFLSGYERTTDRNPGGQPRWS